MIRSRSFDLFSTGKLTLAVAAFGLLGAAQADANQWAVRYNGNGNGADYADTVATDNLGNTYVSGDSTTVNEDTDIVTLKYDAAGTRVWTKRFAGPGGGNDCPKKIAVDPSGNVIVAGYASNLSGQEYVVVKYSPDGTRLWYRMDSGRSGGGGSIPSDMTLDGAGNVYVTGYSLSDATGWDYWTVKYGANGDLIWSQRYSGLGGTGSDSAIAIAVDLLGNVIVTGNSWSDTTGYDIATVKYGADGQFLWARRHSGSATVASDSPCSVRTDTDGNVFVLGNDDHSNKGTLIDWSLIKYGPDGKVLWIRYLNTPANYYDSSRAMEIDASGNVVAIGSSIGPSATIDWYTVKYDTSGNRLWIARYNDPSNMSDYPNAIAIDGDSNVIVTGLENGGSGSETWNAATIKYNANGQRQWIHRFGTTNGRMDLGSAIAVDGLGNVSVAGTSTTATQGTDYLILRYGP